MKGLILSIKSLKDYAIDDFKKALSHKNKNLASVNKIYNLLSERYIAKKNYKEAIFFLEKWKQDYLNNNELYEADINFHNLGISYLHLKNYKKAEENLLKSHELNLFSNDTIGLAYSSSDLANLYYVQYKDDLATKYFKQGLQYAKKGNDLFILQNAYLNMAVVEENSKNYKVSLDYRKNYEKIKDSIWGRDKIGDLAQKDKEVAEKVSTERLLVEKKQKKRILVFSGVIFLSLLIVSFLSFKINKQRKSITNQNNKLEQLSKFKSDLFAILGHDLRSPMHHILNINKQIQNELKEKNTIVLKKLVNDGSISANKMYFLLDNLLHWMLLQTNQLFFQKESLNVKKIATQVLANFTPLLKEKNIQLTVDIPITLKMISDFNSIKVVLRNIIDNAIKFTPKNGIIKVSGQLKNEKTIITIVDNGIGFNSDVIGANKNLTPQIDVQKNKGTGFGLYIYVNLLQHLMMEILL